MKKINIAILLILILSLVLVGCGKNDERKASLDDFTLEAIAEGACLNLDEKIEYDEFGDMSHGHHIVISEPYFVEDELFADIMFVMDRLGNPEYDGERASYDAYYPELRRQVLKKVMKFNTDKGSSSFESWDSVSTPLNVITYMSGHDVTLEDSIEKAKEDSIYYDYLVKSYDIPFVDEFDFKGINPISKSTIERIRLTNHINDNFIEQLYLDAEKYGGIIDDGEPVMYDTAPVDNPIQVGEYYEASIKNISYSKTCGYVDEFEILNEANIEKLSHFKTYGYVDSFQIFNEVSFDVKVSIEDVKNYPESLEYINQYSSGYEDGKIVWNDECHLRRLTNYSNFSLKDEKPIHAKLRFEFSNIESSDGKVIKIAKLLPFYKFAMVNGNLNENVEILMGYNDEDIHKSFKILNDLSFETWEDKYARYIKSGTDSLVLEYDLIFKTYNRDTDVKLAMVMNDDMWSYWDSKETDHLENYVYFNVE